MACRVMLLLWSMIQILAFLGQSEAKIVTGLTTTEENWIFLTRFCFLSQAGRFEYHIEYPLDYDLGAPDGAQNIILYHDDQWTKVYGDEKTCQDRESILERENNQIVNLTSRYIWGGCAIETRDVATWRFQKWYVCRGRRTFSSSRERWWFVVLNNCKSTKGMYLNYTITMTNDVSNNSFFKHFSADEFYILQETIAMVIVYALIITLTIYVAYSLHIRQLYHTTFKIYMASIFMELFALFAQIVYWADYAHSGMPKIGWKNFGRFMEFASQALFLILLIVMGKGFTITRGRISQGGTIKIIVFSLLYIGLTLAMFIWEVTSFDPGLVLYIYDSIPGYILIAVKIAGWLWFLYAIFFTLKHYPEKASFYIPFLVAFTIWFWLGSAVALAAISAIPRWMREKIVQGCTLFVIFLGHLVFLVLTWPTLANKTFPYHIKTTQVGAMEAPQSYQNNGEVLSGGAYGPSNTYESHEPVGEEHFIGMFTTDRSRSNGRQNRAESPSAMTSSYSDLAKRMSFGSS